MGWECFVITIYSGIPPCHFAETSKEGPANNIDVYVDSMHVAQKKMQS